MDTQGADNWFQWLLDFTQQHPLLAGVFVFMVALLESLVIVGIPVPGAILMVSIGALIAFDALPLWPTLLWAIAGAIVGDGLSFWVGHHYRERLWQIWPFTRFTHLMAKGQHFFERHGGKSVVMGRFIGPIRPFIPTIAGMMGMSPKRFFVINVLSAFAWAPAYILPGVAFGASMALASEVALRLAIMLLVVLLSIWFLWWLVRHLYRFSTRHAESWLVGLMHWSHRHPHLGPLVRSFIDPTKPESRVLFLFAILLLIGLLLGFFLIVQTGLGIPVGRIDTHVYNTLQSLRTPWGDALFIVITMMGDAAVYLAVCAVAILILIKQKRISAMLYLLAALGFGAAATQLLKWGMHVPRPDSLSTQGMSFSFPSAHAAMSTVVYGFLTVLVGRYLQRRGRERLYVASASLIVAIAFSRLYLGVHWLSDVLAGVGLGMAWVALLGIAYYRHHFPAHEGRVLLTILVLSTLVATGVRVITDYSDQVSRYRADVLAQPMSYSDWGQQGWRQLALARNDFGGTLDHPFNLQWAGPLHAIERDLKQHGWQEPVVSNPLAAMRWLSPSTPITELPVLPHLHRGRRQSLLLVKPINNQHQWVIRLWPALYRFSDQQTALWIGTITRQRIESRLALLSYPVTELKFDEPITEIQQDLENWQYRTVKRKGIPDRYQSLWDGSVLIVQHD